MQFLRYKTFNLFLKIFNYFVLILIVFFKADVTILNLLIALIIFVEMHLIYGISMNYVLQTYSKNQFLLFSIILLAFTLNFTVLYAKFILPILIGILLYKIIIHSLKIVLNKTQCILIILFTFSVVFLVFSALNDLPINLIYLVCLTNFILITSGKHFPKKVSHNY
jgi:hypothetical protein